MVDHIYRTIEWCHGMKKKFRVIPMKSWGQLPMSYVDAWRDRSCDLIFSEQRMGSKTLSSCPHVPSMLRRNDSTISLSKEAAKNDSKHITAPPSSSSSSSFAHSNMHDHLPLIAIMAATTTRKVNKPSTKSLSLFTYLLPSLIRTLDCGFRYEYVLGYDQGDPFYDSEKVNMHRWMD
jgi:hypothetical protein